MKYKLYTIVLKQLAPIHKGVQASHAVAEFMNDYGHKDDVKQWVDVDQTIVMLESDLDTIEWIYNEYISLEIDGEHIKVSCFHESDLGGLMTAISILVDERVWDRETYPKYDFLTECEVGTERNIHRLRCILSEMHTAR